MGDGYGAAEEGYNPREAQPVPTEVGQICQHAYQGNLLQQYGPSLAWCMAVSSSMTSAHNET